MAVWHCEVPQREAIALQGEEIYNRYDRYLSGGAELFHEGYLDIAQYTLEK